MIRTVAPGAVGAYAAPLVAAAIAGLAAGATPARGQVAVAGPVEVTPAAHCGASSAFSALAGSGHRRLWTTPIRVPVADLAVLGGGLTPDRVGGGMTTETLHLRGADGRRYVFRSVQKTTRQSLAEEFWGTPVETILRDQLCSFHPSGAPVVARLLDAVDVLHPEPALVVIPDDPRLGEFRTRFAGMLALFEERPDEPPGGGPGFAGSDRVVQIENLFDALESDPAERIAADELLRARLIDVLVGDRDRSINNHLWARFERPGGGHLWRPVPRDRDQAFVRFDGAAKTFLRLWDRRLVAFAADYPDLEGLTRVAWDIDRTLLVGLGREDWDRIVGEVRSALTDPVIADAVARMPAAHAAVAGEAIAAALRQRRDALPRAARAMYATVFRWADVRATDADERVLVRPAGDGGLRITIARRTADAGAAPHFDRTFRPAETREVRLYLHGGDDRVDVESGDSPIVLRIIGGGGRDELAAPPGVRPRVLFYDDGDGSRVTGGARHVRRDVPRLHSWWVDGEGDLDWGSESRPLPALGYDRDRGLSIGLGVRRERYGFLRQPFDAATHTSVAWALGRSQPILDFRADLVDRLGAWDLGFDARYSGIEVVRFYGLGNRTAEADDPAYHRVFQKQLAIGISVGPGDERRRRLRVGPLVRHVSSDTAGAGILADLRPYGTGGFTQAGLRLEAGLDGREAAVAPTRGYRVQGSAEFFPALLDVATPFGSARGEAAIYLAPSGGNPVLALRAGGQKVWGRFPYSDAAFIGGRADVRGLREQRFAGDASVYGNAELRVRLARLLLVLPTDVGVLGFLDSGRVFAAGRSDGPWHASRGAGFWVAPVERAATVHVALARHGGRTSVYGGLGFAF